MRKALIGAAAFFAPVLIRAAPAAALLFPVLACAVPAAEFFRRARPAIPVIFSGGGICAGAALEGELILTAAHCVDRLRGARVAFPEKKIERVIEADVIALESELDLALLRPREATGAPGLKLAPDDAGLEPGVFLATIGHPLGAIRPRYDTEDFTEYLHYYSAGALAKLTRQELVLAITVGHGNSGGPVLNERGELVSVISRIANAFVYSPTPLMVRQFIARNRARASLPVSPWSGASNWDLYLWAGGHSYVDKLTAGERRGLSFGELAWNWADRVGLHAATNGGGTFRYSSVAVAWRQAHLSDNPLLLFYSELSLEAVSFTTVNPLQPNERIGHEGPGISYTLNSGRSGFAIRLGAQRIEGQTETHLSLAVFL